MNRKLVAVLSTTVALLLFVGAAWARPARAGELAAAVTSGELDRAEALAGRRASADDAEDAKARCRLILFQNRSGPATACFEALLAKTPADKDALSGLAFAAWRADDFALAADAYARAGRTLREAEARALAAVPAYRIAAPRRRYLVPFERRDPLPLLKVRLADGTDHLFILDTGAAETLLDPVLASRIGVTALQGSSTGVFAGGRTASVRYGVLATMTLGELTIDNTPVQLQSTAPFSALFGGAPIEGVIGVDLLRHFTSTIDYPASRLVLETPGLRAASKRRGQPFWMADDHLILARAQIDGVPELALVDTGLAGQGCTLPASTLAQIGQRPGGERISGVGGGGAASAVAFSASSISLGSARQAGVPCLFGPFPPTIETSAGTRIGLLLSHAFLERYAVTFEFEAMRLSTVP